MGRWAGRWIESTLTDLDAGNEWYLVADQGMTERGDEARAPDLDVYVSADHRTLTELWSGDLGWQAALDQGRLRLHGTAELVRTLPAWFGRTPFPRREPRASLTSQGG